MSKYRVENMKKLKSKGKGKDKRKTTKLASVMAESIMITREDRRHIRFIIRGGCDNLVVEILLIILFPTSIDSNALTSR